MGLSSVPSCLRTKKGFLVKLMTLPIDLDNYRVGYSNFTCQGLKRTQAIMVLTGLTWDPHPPPLSGDSISAHSGATSLCSRGGVLVSSSWALLIQTLTPGVTSDLPDDHRQVGDTDFELPPALPLLQLALLPGVRVVGPALAGGALPCWPGEVPLVPCPLGSSQPFLCPDIIFKKKKKKCLWLEVGLSYSNFM